MIDRKKVIKGLEETEIMLKRTVDRGGEMAVMGAFNCYNHVSNAIALLIEQGWNLLTEDANGIIHGLPGDDGQYLMTDGKSIWIDDYMDGVEDGIFLDSGRDIREITAWMYMPNPPKQEGRFK